MLQHGSLYVVKWYFSRKLDRPYMYCFTFDLQAIIDQISDISNEVHTIPP